MTETNGAGEAPAPRRRIQTERRTRPLRLGIASCVTGLLVVVGGGLLLTAMSAAQVIGADDRAEIPDELRFDAEARRYAIVLIRDPVAFGVPGDPVAGAQLRRHAGRRDHRPGEREPAGHLPRDGRRRVGRRLRGRREGETTIACSFANSTNPELYFVAVAERASWAIPAYAMVAAGLVVIGVGVGLIIIGVHGRMVVVDP